MHWVTSTHPSSSSVFVCRKWMSCCCRPSYTAWLISRGETTSNEPCLSPRHIFHRMGPFCNRLHIKHCLEPSFSSLNVAMTPHFVFCFFLSSILFFLEFKDQLLIYIYRLMFANSQKLLQKSIFVNVVVQGHAIFAKKKEKKNYYLKINVPKVTMLCKWPLIYVWILAIPLFYPFEYWLLGSEYPDSDLPLHHFGLFSPLARGTNQAVSGKKPLTKPKQKDWILLSHSLFAKFSLPWHLPGSE